jgi:hypothetical protein
VRVRGTLFCPSQWFLAVLTDPDKGSRAVGHLSMSRSLAFCAGVGSGIHLTICSNLERRLRGLRTPERSAAAFAGSRRGRRSPAGASIAPPARRLRVAMEQKWPLPLLLLRSPPRASNCFSSSPHRRTARDCMRTASFCSVSSGAGSYDYGIARRRLGVRPDGTEPAVRDIVKTWITHRDVPPVVSFPSP